MKIFSILSWSTKLKLTLTPLTKHFHSAGWKVTRCPKSNFTIPIQDFLSKQNPLQKDTRLGYISFKTSFNTIIMLDHHCTYCDPNDGDTVQDIDVFDESGDDL